MRGLSNQFSIGRTARTLRLAIVSQVYFRFRIFLHKREWMLRCSEVLRGYWTLGPFRQYAVRYHQRRKKNRPLQVDRRDLFPELDVKQVVTSLNEKGYANGVTLPTEYVTQIIQYCEKTRLTRYWNPHKECDAINRIARNEKIVEIARQYLGTEPILWLTLLRWSFGDAAQARKLLSPKHEEPLQYDANAFHYDILDFKSVTLFIYLTDVDLFSGPHIVMGGTHATKSFADICHRILSDAVAHQKFGDRAQMILGPKGTMFFEETSSYHKGSHCHTQRLLLSIDYVLQRRPPPDQPVIRESSSERLVAV